ncbi:MAG: hypothetical protein LBU04_01145 [Christensenellaceae bacterium]|jgi:predicted chitinase|nr:hypothetical protein [Christensenellaceae bacterium]
MKCSVFTKSHAINAALMLVAAPGLKPAVAQQLTNSASTPQQKQEVNINELLPSQQTLHMMKEAIEYTDKLSKSDDVQKFVDSTGCSVHISGFYNHVVKQGEKPNGIATALMEGIKKFVDKDVSAANQPHIRIDVLWIGLKDGGEDYVSAKTRVRTQMETTPTVGSHFIKEKTQAFTSAIRSYTDTSLNINSSRADQRIIKELETLRKESVTADFPCSKCNRELKITHQKLIDIFPKSKIIEENPITVDYFQTSFEKAPLNACYRIAHFLAQIDHESDGMQAKEENLDYTMEKLLKTFNTTSSAKLFFKQSFWDNKEYLKYAVKDVYGMVDTTKSEKGDYDATAYVTYKYKKNNADTIRIPVSFTLNKGQGLYKKIVLTSSQKQENKERWVNQVYGAREDLGNGGPETGDGYKYRGRGAIQLTGKKNYMQVSERCNKLFGTSYNWVNNPNMVATDLQANIYAAIGYILNAFSDLSVLDGNNVSAVTIKINTKQLGLSEREKKFDALIQTKYKCK